MITIFTPTYNRSHLLPRLYESLLRQTSNDFEWMIVDDGSTDNTAEIVASWSAECEKFAIRYIRQKNQGKHIAINTGASVANGEWFLVVDSDDYLKNDAVETILLRVLEVRDNADYCGVTVLRVYENGEIVGGNVSAGYRFDSDYFSYRHIEKITGDRAEVFRTAYLRKYPFPKYEGEKFMNESVLCYRMAYDYKCLFTDDRLYVCEYQKDGLSSGTQKLYNNNPLGCMLNAIIAFNHPKCSLRFKLRYAGYYKHYLQLAVGRGADIPDELKSVSCNMKLLGITGHLLRLIKNKGKDPLKI